MLVSVTSIELSLRGKKSKKPANPKGGIISMLTAKNGEAVMVVVAVAIVTTVTL